MAGMVMQKGFTIVETMLVLGISGLMLAGIMASVGAGISAQRYKDAANATVDYFQGQYNLTANTRNDRGDDSYCSASGITATPRAEFRATSECTVVGRIVRGNGTDASSTPLYATVSSDSLVNESDPLQALIESKIVEDTARAEKYTIEWGARLFPAGNRSQSQKYSIAIIRSPFTGVINTFMDTASDTSSVDQVISHPDALTKDAIFCIDAAGGMTNILSSTLGVKMRANGANASGVSLISDGGGC